MKTQPLLHIVLIIATLTLGCSSSDDSNTTNTTPPEKAALVFPDNNQECTEGANFTATESDILFEWTAANNAVNYQLVVTNLNTQTTETYDASAPQLSVRVLRATPYAWHVIAKNNTNFTTQSDTWRFYNAGEATSTYAPFPAEVITPAMGASIRTTGATLTLEWNSSDVDNDIIHHNVRFGTTTPPTTVIENAIVDQTATATITPGNTYYWQVVTVDGAGNTSQSRIFQFKVD